MRYCGIVASGSYVHLCAFEEVRHPEPPITLEAIFYEPATPEQVAAEVRAFGDAVVGIAAPIGGPRDGREARVCDVEPNKGTIYVWAPVPEGHDSASYCELVLEESGVVVSPGGAFGPNGEGFFRISLTVPDERLTEAVERLRSSLGG